jgi:tRNA uridine 5-carboxymethylaminomethyl modification enzyme
MDVVGHQAVGPDVQTALLRPLAEQLGMLRAQEEAELERRLKEEDGLVRAARETTISATAANKAMAGAEGAPVSERQRVADLVRRPGVSLRKLLEAACGEVPAARDDSWMSAEIEIKYEGYLKRERDSAGKLAELASFHLPSDMPYLEIESLSTEARQKLAAVRPESLAQAGRIPGVSPSDLQNLVFEVIRRRQAAA